jgi:hypothetical protein
LARHHTTSTNDEIPTPGEEQPLVSGKQTYSPPLPRSTTRRLVDEENTQSTHNAAKEAIDNIFNIANPSQRQAAVLQLLGDEEENRESVLRNAAHTSTTNDIPYALAQSNDEPSSFKRATLGKICDKWTKTIASEYEPPLANKTWSLVDYPQNAKIIGCMWRLKIKRDADGIIIKYKSRICARGDQQTNEIDYN